MAVLNLPEISVGDAVIRLLRYYKKAIVKGRKGKAIQSVMLWGKSGIGKSTCVYELAEKLEKELQETLGKKIKVNVREIRLATCSQIELVGVPTADAERKHTIWLEPEFFEEPKDPNTYVIYFFDELDKAVPSVQASALQLILDRKCFEHSLASNHLVIAAGNPEMIDTEMSSGFKPELSNRFKHYLLTADFESWKIWAMENQVHPYIIDYLSYVPHCLYSEHAQDQTAFVTPRSWSFVSDTLNDMLDEETSLSDLYVDIAASIGEGEAQEFIAWVLNFAQVPGLKEIMGIFEGKACPYPKTPDSLNFLTKTLVTYLKILANDEEKKQTLSPQQWKQQMKIKLDNVTSYVSHFPADYAAVFFHDAGEIPELKSIWPLVPKYMAWKGRN